MSKPFSLVLISVLAICGCSRAKSTKTPPREFKSPRDVLAEGNLTVDVMQIVAPPRASELGQRLQQAAQANPDWFMEHAKKGRPGEPLPYDSRFGVTEAEYNEFLALSKKMSAQKRTEAPLSFTQKGDDVYVLDGGQTLSDLTGVEIDMASDLVRTPFGVLSERSEIDASEEAALGAWVGIQWMLEDPGLDGVSGTVAKFALGKLKQSGRCVIYYDVKQISVEGNTRISQILNYDLPQ